MMDQPLVSIIMIFLNGAAFMREAIESVREQTYSNWELVLIDDGSSDESVQIARGYAQNCPEKIRYVDHPGHANLGMSASRNRGVRVARGSFIAFLDADDVYLPQKIEKQAAILASHPTAAMVYGPTLHWFSWTGKKEDAGRDKLRRLGVAPGSLYTPPTLPVIYLRNIGLTPATCGVLIRRQAIEDVGGFEESFRGMFEDQAFFYKMGLHFPVYVESGSWDWYRQHAGSAVSVALKKGQYKRYQPNPSHLAFYTWLEQYLIQKDIQNDELWKPLRANLWPYHHPYLYQVKSLAKRVWGAVDHFVGR